MVSILQAIYVVGTNIIAFERGHVKYKVWHRVSSVAKLIKASRVSLSSAHDANQVVRA